MVQEPNIFLLLFACHFYVTMILVEGTNVNIYAELETHLVKTEMA